MVCEIYFDPIRIHLRNIYFVAYYPPGDILPLYGGAQRIQSGLVISQILSKRIIAARDRRIFTAGNVTFGVIDKLKAVSGNGHSQGRFF
ncbi:hypothetical protein AFK62_12395 [Cronobacter condimenti 1330]|uniref:Uncharacterized protein n=1 Tax=Cronobacter condimenti 1330 TaxID=1073999 RepID=A0ABN4IA84_9ENTR|nr:hypothetical protein AFK62_12395 [Cronobacter condimenti 1330]